MKYPTKRLIIWRSLVQAQAGPLLLFSDSCFGASRCFFMQKQTKKLFRLNDGKPNLYKYVNKPKNAATKICNECKDTILRERCQGLNLFYCIVIILIKNMEKRLF